MQGGTADRVVWKARWDIRKFKDPDGRVAQASMSGADVRTLGPCAHDTIEDNCTLSAGCQHLIDLIAGTGVGVPWDNTHAHIGVGDDDTPAEPAQTGLLGANKTYRPMDATYPQRMGRTCYWRATFGPDDAVHRWAEYSIANGFDESAVHLNRKVQVRGDKLQGDTWVMDLEILFGKEGA